MAIVELNNETATRVIDEVHYSKLLHSINTLGKLVDWLADRAKENYETIEKVVSELEKQLDQLEEAPKSKIINPNE